MTGEYSQGSWRFKRGYEYGFVKGFAVGGTAALLLAGIIVMLSGCEPTSCPEPRHDAGSDAALMDATVDASCPEGYHMVVGGRCVTDCVPPACPGGE